MEIKPLLIFLFLVSLILGHVGGYYLVRYSRARGLNDFVPLGLSCFFLFLFGIADVILRQWYIHPAGFGILMGTIMFLAAREEDDQA